MKAKILPCILIVILIVLGGCTAPAGNNQENNSTQPQANDTKPAANNADNSGLGEKTDSGLESGIELKEWAAQDNSITLQIPAGWNASEKQADKCTVNWSAENPEATKSVYMNNQVLVFKSEDAKEIYKAYGLAGADSVPVAAYMIPEEAVSKIIAPLGGSSNVAIAETDYEMSSYFSQAVCIQGLAACNALVFDATYINRGIAMKGKYFVQTLDLGDGSTWWINIWGYTSPAAEWEKSKALLEQIFTSVKYTDSWKAKCEQNSESAASVINEVIKKRLESSENNAEQWDAQIRN
ncbi:MAG: hypothetical protein PHH08_03100 [Candidatus ainarchaeum sp.]|nr:hypothetical protein [Candidatus ainarchaeum sp.]